MIFINKYSNKGCIVSTTNYVAISAISSGVLVIIEARHNGRNAIKSRYCESSQKSLIEFVVLY